MRLLFLVYSLFSLLLGEIHSRRFGTPEGIRIPDLPLRRRTLYPAELRVHKAHIIIRKGM